METYIDDIRRSTTTASAVRTVFVVTNQPQGHLFETLVDANCDVVIVEEAAHAYSHIKSIDPQLVIVCLDLDDMEGLQVLSMLKLDPQTSHIPVETLLTPRESEPLNDDWADPRVGVLATFLAVPMN